MTITTNTTTTATTTTLPPLHEDLFRTPSETSSHTSWNEDARLSNPPSFTSSHDQNKNFNMSFNKNTNLNDSPSFTPTREPLRVLPHPLTTPSQQQQQQQQQQRHHQQQHQLATWAFPKPSSVQLPSTPSRMPPNPPSDENPSPNIPLFVDDISPSPLPLDAIKSSVFDFGVLNPQQPSGTGETRDRSASELVDGDDDDDGNRRHGAQAEWGFAQRLPEEDEVDDET